MPTKTWREAYNKLGMHSAAAALQPPFTSSGQLDRVRPVRSADVVEKSSFQAGKMGQDHEVQ